MNVKRVISVYDRNDNDKLISEYSLNNIPLDELKKIVKAKVNDPNLYQVYSLVKDQVLALSTFILELEKIDFDEVELYYECFSSD